MIDNEAQECPESFVDDEEMKAALDETVGDGSPHGISKAPEELPPATLVERVRDLFVRTPR